MESGEQKIERGQIRRHELLGSDAVYRILSWDDALVEVEVVRAPGLAPGRRFKFSRQAVLAMEVVADDRL